jgi:vancomycin permeability regulator SanA
VAFSGDMSDTARSLRWRPTDNPGLRRWMTMVVVSALAGVELMVTLSATWVWARSEGRVFSIEEAPPAPVGIVFGAAVSEQRSGSYLKPRLDTAVALFKRGAIVSVLVSGDSTPPNDDEVSVMRRYLEDNGVPDERIIVDPRGFDTDDTCRRAHDRYRVARALLVTQDFHVGRAVALCRAWQIDAFGVIAGCACSQRSLLRNYFREAFLSRPAAFLYAMRA